MLMYYYLNILILEFMCHHLFTVAITLDQALLDDMFVSSSTKCTGSSTGETRFNFDFSPSNISKWWSPNAHFEKNTFLAEMKHYEPNQNRTWKIRIGTGGYNLNTYFD